MSRAEWQEMYARRGMAMPTALTLLFMLSACRRAVGRRLAAASAWLRSRGQRSPSALAAASPATDPRRHAPVCCCLRCEEHGTGEQAMRAVGGDYARFLDRVVSPKSRTASPAGQAEGPSCSVPFALSCVSEAAPRRTR